MHDKVFAKFLHDIASPLSGLMLMADDHKELMPPIQMMANLIDFYRSIFFTQTFTSADMENLIEKIAQYHKVICKIEFDHPDTVLNKIVLMLSYVLCRSMRSGTLNITQFDSEIEIKVDQIMFKQDDPLWVYVNEVIRTNQLQLRNFGERIVISGAGIQKSEASE